MKPHVSILLVALTHINHAIALGFIFTNGIYQVTFLETFSKGSTLTSWVSSVQLGMLCLAGEHSFCFFKILELTTLLHKILLLVLK